MRTETLQALLPEIYRRRDAESGRILQALLQVIAEQVTVVDDELDQLYRDWFIETCQDWVVPYIGDLVGYRAIGGLSPVQLRRDVANTVPARRRKGTLAVLEDLAAGVGGWPARAVECNRLLGHTAPIRLYRPGREPAGQWADLRDIEAMELLGGPFERTAHLIDVPGVASPRGQGRYNIGNVAVFLWRLKAHRITRQQAAAIAPEGSLRFTFSPFGADLPLMTKPYAEPAPTQIAQEINVPALIRRRALVDGLPDYYGPERSFCLWLGDATDPVPVEELVVCNLSGWVYQPAAHQIAIDPELGRIALGSDYSPKTVWVSYCHGFPDEIGGGEYPRLYTTVTKVYPVGAQAQDDTVTAALNRWQEDSAADSSMAYATIEILDSRIYVEDPSAFLLAGQRLQVRAADGARPVLMLSKRLEFKSAYQGEREGPPSLALDGLTVTGGAVEMLGEFDTIEIEHCTLAPASMESVRADDKVARMAIRHSILGRLTLSSLESGPPTREPAELEISDSILDGGDPQRAVLTSAASGDAIAYVYARVSVQRSTVRGAMHPYWIGVIENSICLGKMSSARRQFGCVRYSWLPTDSETPARFRCQPDAAIAAAAYLNSDLVAHRTEPDFTSQAYGTPAYFQLSAQCPAEIARGADDGSEMGVYHDLLQPLRIDGLRARLDEYTPANAMAGLIFVT